MRGMNRLFLIGRVGGAPESRRDGTGRPWCPLTIGTRREARRADGSTVDCTDWHEVQLVGRAATVAEHWVRRGTIVAVEGSVVYEPWHDAHGLRHRETRIVASRLVVMGLPHPEPLDADAGLPELRQRHP